MSDSDPFALARFIEAQRGVYAQALAELRTGRKRSHWMWFVFPQLAGLGRSAMAERYALSGLDEAAAYLRHPLLGPRLRECVQAALDCGIADPHLLLGFPDDLKFRSCLTLFERVAGGDPLFSEALQRFYSGERDGHTLALLSS